MNIAAAIASLELAVGDARQGLPEDIFLLVGRLAPLINVDLLIKDNVGRTLLTWRDDEFFGTGWHIPGGIIRYKETTVDRIRACARTELGAEVEFDEVPILISECIRDRRDRAHFVSLLYRCFLRTAPKESLRAAQNPPARGEWLWHDHCPPDLLGAHAHYAHLL
jgi:ADP-ribose pyrophosphatase YjhB (NUDIX family)